MFDYEAVKSVWRVYKETSLPTDAKKLTKDELGAICDVLNHAIMTGLQTKYDLVSLLSAVYRAKLSK